MNVTDEEKKERKVLVVGGTRGYEKLAGLVSFLQPGCRGIPRPLESRPAKKLSQADFDRMESAESKRNRRIHRAKEQAK